jgi:hypothetical protein
MQNSVKKFANFVIFQTATGKVNIDVLFTKNTLWLSQKLMSVLFECSTDNISLHLKNIFKEKELAKKATTEDFSLVAKEGNREVSRKLKYYNLSAIIAVGFRVNSHRATQFRKWSNNILQEYTIKGFVMDDERLKQIKHFGQDYFDEMLERIREIRLSERRIYQKITDIYRLSADYNSQENITQHFFASVQNKLHWAITGKTAAQIIYTTADYQKINMGLTTWKNAPYEKILKSDVIIAKNYLSQEHIKQLELIVSSYLDMAENKARNKQVMNMDNWADFLQGFLELSDYPILRDNGKITKLQAQIKAHAEYDKFRVLQDKNYISDFDKTIKQIKV